MIFLNKKAQTEEIIQWIIYIAIALVVSFSIYSIFKGFR
jgi:hypothetical protein